MAVVCWTRRTFDRRVSFDRVFSGFGASVARKLAAKGAIVAVLDRDEEGGKKVVAELVDKWAFVSFVPSCFR